MLAPANTLVAREFVRSAFAKYGPLTISAVMRLAVRDHQAEPFQSLVDWLEEGDGNQPTNGNQPIPHGIAAQIAFSGKRITPGILRGILHDDQAMQHVYTDFLTNNPGLNDYATARHAAHYAAAKYLGLRKRATVTKPLKERLAHGANQAASHYGQVAFAELNNNIDALAHARDRFHDAAGEAVPPALRSRRNRARKAYREQFPDDRSVASLGSLGAWEGVADATSRPPLALHTAYEDLPCGPGLAHTLEEVIRSGPAEAAPAKTTAAERLAHFRVSATKEHDMRPAFDLAKRALDGVTGPIADAIQQAIGAGGGGQPADGEGDPFPLGQLFFRVSVNKNTEMTPRTCAFPLSEYHLTTLLGRYGMEVGRFMYQPPLAWTPSAIRQTRRNGRRDAPMLLVMGTRFRSLILNGAPGSKWLRRRFPGEEHAAERRRHEVLARILQAVVTELYVPEELRDEPGFSFGVKRMALFYNRFIKSPLNRIRGALNVAKYHRTMPEKLLPPELRDNSAFMAQFRKMRRGQAPMVAVERGANGEVSVKYTGLRNALDRLEDPDDITKQRRKFKVLQRAGDGSRLKGKLRYFTGENFGQTVNKTGPDRRCRKGLNGPGVATGLGGAVSRSWVHRRRRIEDRVAPMPLRMTGEPDEYDACARTNKGKGATDQGESTPRSEVMSDEQPPPPPPPPPQHPDNSDDDDDDSDGGGGMGGDFDGGAGADSGAGADGGAGAEADGGAAAAEEKDDAGAAADEEEDAGAAGDGQLSLTALAALRLARARQLNCRHSAHTLRTQHHLMQRLILSAPRWNYPVSAQPASYSLFKRRVGFGDIPDLAEEPLLVTDVDGADAGSLVGYVDCINIMLGGENRIVERPDVELLAQMIHRAAVKRGVYIWPSHQRLHERWHTEAGVHVKLQAKHFAWSVCCSRPGAIKRNALRRLWTEGDNRSEGSIYSVGLLTRSADGTLAMTPSALVRIHRNKFTTALQGRVKINAATNGDLPPLKGQAGKMRTESAWTFLREHCDLTQGDFDSLARFGSTVHRGGHFMLANQVREFEIWTGSTNHPSTWIGAYVSLFAYGAARAHSMGSRSWTSRVPLTGTRTCALLNQMMWMQPLMSSASAPVFLPTTAAELSRHAVFVGDHRVREKLRKVHDEVVMFRPPVGPIEAALNICTLIGQE